MLNQKLLVILNPLLLAMLHLLSKLHSQKMSVKHPRKLMLRREGRTEAQEAREMTEIQGDRMVNLERIDPTAAIKIVKGQKVEEDADRGVLDVVRVAVGSLENPEVLDFQFSIFK
jgi:hypothetical protein